MNPRLQNSSRRRFGRLLARELGHVRFAHWIAVLPAVKLAQALIALLAASLIRWSPPAGPGGGLALAWVFWTLILLPLALSILWPWWRLPSARRLLREVESRREKSQILETAADFVAGSLDGKGYSEEILDEVLGRAVGELTEGLPPPRRPSARRWFSGAALVALALVLMLLPSAAGIRPLAFLLTPESAAHYEERAWLEVEPGSVERLAGTALRLEARERGLPWRFSGEVRLEIDETGDLFRPAPLEREDEAWVHAVDELRQGFHYRFTRGRWQGATHEVRLYYPPVLDSLSMTATPPAYTDLPGSRLDLRSGELSLPAGSRLDLEGWASSPLVSAWLRFEKGDSLPLAVSGTRLEGDFGLEENLRIGMTLRDEHGTESRTPWLLALRPVPDRAPEVSILSPGLDAELRRDLRVAVQLLAADDYGVSDLRLRAFVQGRADTMDIPVPLGGKPGPRVAERVNWDLAGTNLFPGDVVEYWAEVRDNRPVKPGIGLSRRHRLRMPSLREIFEEVEREDLSRGESVEELLDEGERMQEELRRLEEELRADPELDWEKEEELREAFERQEEMAEQLADLAHEMEQRLDRLVENEMLRTEMAEKMEQIQDILEELADTEAGDILKRFQEMLDSMDPENLPDELRDLRMDQESLLEELERTQALLERILREQKMDALLQQTDELLREQDRLREESEDGGEGEDLAERQEQLADEAEALEKKAGEMGEELSEEFTEAGEKLQEEDPSAAEPMRDAAEQMQEQGGDPADAQKEAMQRLLKLYWKVSQASSMMQGQMSAQDLSDLDRLTRAALDFSAREETEGDRIGGLQGQDGADDLLALSARRQMDLYRVLDRLREDLLEVAARTLAVSPKALRESRAALGSLERSVAELELRRGSAGLSAAGEALYHSNVVVITLLHGLRQSGQSSGSCTNPLGQMQSMLKQQEQLNRGSQSLKKQLGPGGLSPEQQAAMQRLKGEQQALREGVEEMIEGGESGLGRLDKTVEEMREVEKDLASGRLTDETLRRQEKIFERLLDAQRSLHRQDFKRERRSKEGENLRPLWPGADGEGDPLAALRDAIRRGLGESAPPEYEELIREYYRRLLEQERRELAP